MGMKPRRTPEAREVILQVRPASGEEHPWWPTENADLDIYAWASIDPYDPPGWSAGLDEDYRIDSIELWGQTGLGLEQHIEDMKQEWLDEYGIEEDYGGFRWEFRVVNC